MEHGLEWQEPSPIGGWILQIEVFLGWLDQCLLLTGAWVVVSHWPLVLRMPQIVSILPSKHHPLFKFGLGTAVGSSVSSHLLLSFV